MSNTVRLRDLDSVIGPAGSDFALEAELTSMGPRLNATEGAPVRKPVAKKKK